MLDIAKQAQEASQRSRTLSVANAAVDAAAGGEKNADVEKTLKERPSKANRADDDNLDGNRGPRGLSRLASPARSIGQAMRMRKHTGDFQADHTGEISIWHLIGHMSRSVTIMYEYGREAAKRKDMEMQQISIAAPVPKESLGAQVRQAFKEGRDPTPSKADIAQAAIAASEGENMPAKTRAPKNDRRSGGMEL